ncbi:MAG: sensor histidine kinase [Longimicrobiales bacterium]
MNQPPPSSPSALTASDLASAGIRLDPDARAAARADDAYRRHAVVYPQYRLLAFALLSAIVLLHNLVLLDDPRLAAVAVFVALTFAYCLLSLALLRRFYAPRESAPDLGDVFFFLDLGVLAAAIFVSGSTRSWLFFLPILRVADQIHGGQRRAMAFAHAGAGAYLLVPAAVALSGGATVDWGQELGKTAIIYIGGMYAALAAGPAQRMRRRTELAVRYASEQIGRLETRTAELASQTHRARSHRADAERVSRGQARLLARVSHELRTPLNHILGFAQLLDVSDLTREQRENLDEIRHGGRRLLALVDQVLRITGTETDDGLLRPEPVDPTLVVRKVLEQLDEAIVARAIDVELNGNALDSGRVALASPAHLEQVLRQLLSNAVRHNRHRGRVVVTIQEEADRLHIGVADNGPGIPADRLDTIFEPFGRLADAGPASADWDPGMGFGLVTAHALVASLGGQLRVSSRVGHGSTFYFDLPTVGGIFALVD